jgi:CMP-N-acetylneuraminic acid synthetase
VVRAISEIDRAIVSTDHAGIARAAEDAGIAAPFSRPEAISGDSVGDIDVLTHALNAIEAIDGRRYDIVVMLQPTSPMRTPDEVLAAVHLLIDGSWDSVWTVSTTDSKSHPLKQLIFSDGALDFYHQAGAEIIARQQMSPVYHRNGVAYAMTRACLIDQRTIKGKRTAGLLLGRSHVSIDTEQDIAFAEFLLGRS